MSGVPEWLRQDSLPHAKRKAAAAAEGQASTPAVQLNNQQAPAWLQSDATKKADEQSKPKWLEETQKKAKEAAVTEKSKKPELERKNTKPSWLLAASAEVEEKAAAADAKDKNENPPPSSTPFVASFFTPTTVPPKEQHVPPPRMSSKGNLFNNTKKTDAEPEKPAPVAPPRTATAAPPSMPHSSAPATHIANTPSPERPPLTSRNNIVEPSSGPKSSGAKLEKVEDKPIVPKFQIPTGRESSKDSVRGVTFRPRTESIHQDSKGTARITLEALKDKDEHPKAEEKQKEPTPRPKSPPLVSEDDEEEDDEEEDDDDEIDDIDALDLPTSPPPAEPEPAPPARKTPRREEKKETPRQPSPEEPVAAAAPSEVTPPRQRIIVASKMIRPKLEMDWSKLRSNQSENGLSEYVLEHILSYLPNRDLAHARLTCREWCRVSEEMWGDREAVMRDQKKRKNPSKTGPADEVVRMGLVVSSTQLEPLSLQMRSVIREALGSSEVKLDSLGDLEEILAKVEKSWNGLTHHHLLRRNRGDQLAADAGQEMGRQITVIREIALMKDSTTRQRVLNILGELEQVIPTYTNSLRKAVSLAGEENTTREVFAEATQQYHNVMTKFTKVLTGEKDVITEGPVVDIQKRAENHMSIISDGLKLAKELSFNINKQVSMSRDALPSVREEKEKADVNSALSSLEALQAQVYRNMKTFLLNPEDIQLRRSMDDFLSNLADSSQILEKLNTLDSKMMTNSRLINGGLDRIRKIVNQVTSALITQREVDSLIDAVKSKITAHVHNTNEKVESVVKNTQMQYKLKQASSKLLMTRDPLVNIAVAIMNDPNRSDGTVELQGLLTEVENHSSIIEKEGHLDKSFSTHTKALREVVKRMTSSLEHYTTMNNYKKLMDNCLEMLQKLREVCESNHSAKTNDPQSYALYQQQLDRELSTSSKVWSDNVQRINGDDSVYSDRLHTLLSRIEKTVLEAQRLHPLQKKVHIQAADIYLCINGLRSFVMRKQAEQTEGSQGGPEAHNVANHIMFGIAFGREDAATNSDESFRNIIVGEMDELENGMEETIGVINKGLESPKDPEAQSLLRNKLQRSIEVLSNTEKRSGRAEDHSRKIRNSLQFVNSCVSSITQAESSIQKYREVFASSIQSTKSLAKSTRDLKSRTFIMDLIDRLEKVNTSIEGTVDEDLASCVRHMREYPQFVTSTAQNKNENAKKMITIMPTPSTDVNQILAEVKTGSSTVDYNLYKMIQRMDLRSHLAKKTALRSTDVQLRIDLIDLANMLDNWMVPLVQAAAAVVADSDDRPAQGKAQHIIERSLQAMGRIEKACESPIDPIPDGITNLFTIMQGEGLKGKIQREKEVADQRRDEKVEAKPVEEERPDVSTDEDSTDEDEKGQKEKVKSPMQAEKFTQGDYQPKFQMPEESHIQDHDAMDHAQVAEINPEAFHSGTIPAYFNLFDFEFLNTDIFGSDFFLLEIERLKTKYEYDNERRATGDIRRQQNVRFPKSTDELMQIAQREELYATHFAEKLEFEWARSLIKQAVLIRMQVYNAFSQYEEAGVEDRQKQLLQIEKNWEKYIYLCLKGQPSEDRTEHGVEKTLELLENAADLAPIHLRDARCAQYVNLWENRVKYALLMYDSVFDRQGPVHHVLERYITPLLQNVPFYLDRQNQVLDYLWYTAEKIHKQAVGLTIQHGIATFKDYLLTLHGYYQEKLVTDNSILPSVPEAFPLFTDVGRSLSLIYLDERDYSSGQELAVEEMMIHLEMDEEQQNDERLLEAWDRVYYCVRQMNSKPSDQFFLLKEVLQEISVYNNNVLKSRIQSDMHSIGNGREVIYNLHYEEILDKCARIHFGDQYDEIASKNLDNASMLEEILINLYAASTPASVQMALVLELGKLADLNYEFQFEVAKNKDFSRAKKVIEEGLLIRKHVDPPSIHDNGVHIDDKTRQSYELEIDCAVALSSKATKSPIAITHLMQAYELRPLYWPYGTEKMKKLWNEMVKVKEFYSDTLENLYRKFTSDKKKVLAETITSTKPHMSGYMIMRVNKTWQKRWMVLEEQVLHFFKNPKALKSSGVIPLRQLDFGTTVPEEFIRMVPEGFEDNLMTLVTPWRGYVVYTETSEDLEQWKSAIERRQVDLSDDGQDHLLEELMINKQLLARHPLILDTLHALGQLWDGQEFEEEAVVMYVLGLEIATCVDNVEQLKRFWNTIYNLMIKTRNIYEILEFLEQEKDRWTAYGLSRDHLLMQLIEMSTARITEEEDLKLRYMYQIRKFKEITEEIVPARIYHLNQIYSLMFLKNGALEDAISLTKDSLELLKRHISTNKADMDELAHYYRLSTWHQLVDLYIMRSREKETDGDYYGGKVLLQSVFDDMPAESLDPFNPYLNKLIDEICMMYDKDPDTAPRSSQSGLESEAFKWVHALYVSYDEHLAQVYSSEALGNKNLLVTYRKAVDRESLEAKKPQFLKLVERFPHMMNLCSKLASAYYLAHQLETALHMTRHVLHVMIAAMPNRHAEIDYQWSLCRKYFLAQRHSNAEIKNFIEEEKLFATVFLAPNHPHSIKVTQQLKQLESKMALYEKYIPAAGWYLAYAALFAVFFYFIRSYKDWQTLIHNYGTLTNVWLFIAGLSLDLGLLTSAMIFITWPPLPIDTIHRTAILLKRKKLVQNVGLLIACHNSAEALPQTLRAALRIFPPEHIFVGDNGNSPKPTDDSEEVCRRISLEYQIQNDLPPESPKINYFYMPEGNKSLVFWYGAKYYCHFKYVMVIDDDVQLPPDLIIPMKRFKIPGTKVLAFTICAENLHTHQGSPIYVSHWQDLEYKLAGFMKMFQSWVGSAIMAHGAISIWERTVMMEVLWRHDTVFHGDDLQMGLILQKLGLEYRIDTCGNVNVPTTVPDHVFCPTRPWSLYCKCGKDGNLLGQRVRSWDVSSHRFIGKFINIILFHWNRTTISIKPFLLYELWSIFQDWVRVPLSVTLFFANPVGFIQVTLIFIAIAVGLNTIFNFWVLRRRPDQQHPPIIFLLFPFYKLLTMVFRFLALIYNMLYYTPFIRNRQILGTRQDLPLGPDHIRMINRIVKEQEEQAARYRILPKDDHDWDIISKLIIKEAVVSPPLSHWFLSCITKLTWKKENPRDKILSGSHLKRLKPITGRTEKFFYTKTRDLFQLVPGTYLTCLNAMCFLSRKGRCLGKDVTKAVKILKWLWVEERLKEKCNDQEKVEEFIRDYSARCEKGVSLYEFVGFMREVLKPTLQYLDTSPLLLSNLFHIHIVNEDGLWGCKSLSLTSSDDRLIVRHFQASNLAKILEVMPQSLVIFIPLPTSEDVVVEPFKPSVVHAALFFNIVERSVTIFAPQDRLADRIYAIMTILEITSLPQFDTIYSLSPVTAACRKLDADEIENRANNFFSSQYKIQSNAQFFSETPYEVTRATNTVKNMFRGEKETSVKRNIMTSSGFWLLPVMDILDGPVLFLDENDKPIDEEIFFEYYGALLDPLHEIQSRPMSALKRKIMHTSGTKFLQTLRPPKEMTANAIDQRLSVSVFRVTGVEEKQFEFRLMDIHENWQVQACVIDYLYIQTKKKRAADEAARKALVYAAKKRKAKLLQKQSKSGKSKSDKKKRTTNMGKKKHRRSASQWSDEDSVASDNVSPIERKTGRHRSETPNHHVTNANRGGRGTQEFRRPNTLGNRVPFNYNDLPDSSDSDNLRGEGAEDKGDPPSDHHVLTGISDKPPSQTREENRYNGVHHILRRLQIHSNPTLSEYEAEDERGKSDSAQPIPHSEDAEDSAEEVDPMDFEAQEMTHQLLIERVNQMEVESPRQSFQRDFSNRRAWDKEIGHSPSTNVRTGGRGVKRVNASKEKHGRYVKGGRQFSVPEHNNMWVKGESLNQELSEKKPVSLRTTRVETEGNFIEISYVPPARVEVVEVDPATQDPLEISQNILERMTSPTPRPDMKKESDDGIASTETDDITDIHKLLKRVGTDDSWDSLEDVRAIVNKRMMERDFLEKRLARAGTPDSIDASLDGEDQPMEDDLDESMLDDYQTSDDEELNSLRIDVTASYKEYKKNVQNGIVDAMNRAREMKGKKGKQGKKEQWTIYQLRTRAEQLVQFMSDTTLESTVMEALPNGYRRQMGLLADLFHLQTQTESTSSTVRFMTIRKTDKSCTPTSTRLEAGMRSICKEDESPKASVFKDELERSKKNGNKKQKRSEKTKKPMKDAVQPKGGAKVGANAAPIAPDNIGNRLLRGMGWDGGGLGSDGQGMVTPVVAIVKQKRTGLGICGFDQSAGQTKTYGFPTRSMSLCAYQGNEAIPHKDYPVSPCLLIFTESSKEEASMTADKSNGAVYKDGYGRDFQVPTFTMKEIYDAIPKHCFERDTLRSYRYVARDLVMVAALVFAASHIHLLPHIALRIVAWTLYTIAQGMVCTGIWVLAHECGHQAFSPSKMVNDCTGWVLHSALLVPYFSWKYTHSKHHKSTGHIDRDMVFKPRSKGEIIKNKNHTDIYELMEETPLYTVGKIMRQQLAGWPAYIIANVTGQTYKDHDPLTVNHFHPDSPLFDPEQRTDIILSDIGVAITASIIAYAVHVFGVLPVMLYYGIPYLWVNHWLVLITYLQHTDPALPHYRGGEWNFQRGAAATIDREFGFIGRHLMHGIIETHVLHHLVSRIPFYHADEATEAIKKVLGAHYQKDETPILTALWRNSRSCQWVEDEGDVVFFHNAHGLGYHSQKAN
ncbi:hypothetical protein PROFUN_04729 [Planoprotostelium fungivorum]|uniref:F-box domain-containing protein n=1 Tax=Planoprotostelium fungivorum TaxID=1890364 RepID=A0A2P6NFX5_9EUKA|nr:hypothetical protein PROFUN_04729 [Planoprotostelium fungivorum]